MLGIKILLSAAWAATLVLILIGMAPKDFGGWNGKNYGLLAYQCGLMIIFLLAVIAGVVGAFLSIWGI